MDRNVAPCRLILLASLALFSACGGGSSAVPQPAISSFTATPAAAVGGQPVTLTAVFSGGAGLITPGNLAVMSGVGVTITPASASQTYTLTVTNATGATQSATATVTLTSGYFTPSGALGSPRVYHTATLLKNGTVLVVGGLNGASGQALDTAELFSPANGTWTYTGSMTTARYGHAATLLLDGKVLVSGGASPSLTTAEIYDPDTGMFTTTGNMNTPRDWPVAVTLASGEVLVVEGDFKTGPPDPPPASEIFAETTGTFSPTGSMAMRRSGGDAVSLKGGGVLIPSGLTAYDIGNSYYGDSELYAPSVGTFAPTGAMITPRDVYGAVLLSNGSVLVAGGRRNISHDVDVSLASAEIFDPHTQTYVATGNLLAARALLTATTLPTGEVLIAGGGQEGGAGYPILGDLILPVTSAERYDPIAKTFGATGAMSTNRYAHTATLLQDGTVLIVGGFTAGGLVTSSTEIYH